MKTKQYKPTKNVGIAPDGATKAELVWLNLTPQTAKRIYELVEEARSTEWANSDWYDLPDDEFEAFCVRARTQSFTTAVTKGRKLAAKAGWRRTHPQ